MHPLHELSERDVVAFQVFELQTHIFLQLLLGGRPRHPVVPLEVMCTTVFVVCLSVVACAPERSHEVAIWFSRDAMQCEAGR